MTSPLRMIVSGPSDGPGNMALDEALFLSACGNGAPAPVLRFYLWNSPCVTIGYFQSSRGCPAPGIPLTRRLTGGLAVRHGNDISYSFVASEARWPELYDQNATYRRIHEWFFGALTEMGIPAVFHRGEGTPRGGSVCVDTLYPHDLVLNGRKIAGSCQRRRGRVLLVQGSVHIGTDRYGEFTEGVSAVLSRLPATRPERGAPTPAELSCAEQLRNVYASSEWNDRL